MVDVVWRADARLVVGDQRAGVDRFRHGVRLWLAAASPDGTDPDIGAACYALATWTATFAVIGMALRFLSGFDAPQHTAVSCQLPAWLMFCKVARAAMLSCDPLSHSLNPKVT